MCLSKLQGLVPTFLNANKAGNETKKLVRTTQQEAERARLETQQREQQRQAMIQQGRGAVDSAFSQFDDNYFNNFKNDYTTNYNTQLDDQFASARDKLIAALAARGMTNSSLGAYQMGNLQERYANERAAIGNRAGDEAAALRGQIESQRGELYDVASSAADPQGVAARATGAVTALRAPQQFGQLGQIFADLLQPIGAGIAADRNSVNPRLGINRPQQIYQSPVNNARMVGG